MTKTSTVNLPVFYTCTAATPDGPPLEIAWGSLAASETSGVLCGSHLVRPPAAWISELARDAAALQPYRLALSDLREFGTPPDEIAAHMNETLTERELFSVVPADDARIRRIFDAAKMAPGFALRITDADELIAELARLQRLSHTVIARARREAEVMCLTGIRAEAKVRFLTTYWGFVAWQNSRRAGPTRPPPQLTIKPNPDAPRRRTVDGAGAVTSTNLRSLFPCPANKPRSSRPPC